MWEARGGDLVRGIYHTVISNKQINSDNKDNEGVLGWLPPTLQNEGSKVRPNGCIASCSIHIRSDRRQFCACRNSIYHRTKLKELINYFAAVDNVVYPYEFKENTRPSYLKELADAHQGATQTDRMNESMKIVSQSLLAMPLHRRLRSNCDRKCSARCGTCWWNSYEGSAVVGNS